MPKKLRTAANKMQTVSKLEPTTTAPFLQHLLVNKYDPDWVEARKDGSRLFNKMPVPLCFSHHYDKLYVILRSSDVNYKQKFAALFKEFVKEFNLLINNDGSPKQEIIHTFGEIDSYRLLGAFFVEAVAGSAIEYFQINNKKLGQTVILEGEDKRRINDYLNRNIQKMLNTLIAKLPIPKDKKKSEASENSQDESSKKKDVIPQITGHLPTENIDEFEQLSRFIDSKSKYQASLYSLDSAVEEANDTYRIIGRQVIAATNELAEKKPNQLLELNEMLLTSENVIIKARRNEDIGKETDELIDFVNKLNNGPDWKILAGLLFRLTTSQYEISKQVLCDAAHTSQNFNDISQLIINETDALMNSNRYPMHELNTILLDARNVIIQSTKADGSKPDTAKLAATAEALRTQTPYGKKLAGLLLGLVGLALITVSVLVAVASFGASTPLSLMGIHLGVSALVAGIAIGVGVASVAGSGFSFFKSNQYRVASNHLEKLADGLTELVSKATPKSN